MKVVGNMSYLVRAFISTLLLVSAVASAKPIERKEWTIFIYAAGDEGTDGIGGEFQEGTLYILKQLEQKPQLKKNTKVNFVLQFDDAGDDSLGWNKQWRRKLTYIENPSTDRIDSPSIPEADIRKYDPTFSYSEANSGDPVTLEKFLDWGVQAYPAEHYLVMLAGHSWGKLGVMQDFFFDGKDHDNSSIIKTYDVTRVLQEIYHKDLLRPRNERLIPRGKFDVLVLDACITGELDVLLEFKDVFDYTYASSIDTPYHAIPYRDVFDDFSKERKRTKSKRHRHLRSHSVRHLALQRAIPYHEAFGNFMKSAHSGEGVRTAKQIEEKLLIPFVAQYITSHTPGGSLVKIEGENDPVESFVIRNSELSKVADRLKALVAKIPDDFRKKVQAGNAEALWSLGDYDQNVDLLQFTRNLKASAPSLSAEADALIAALGYPDQDPAQAFTEIRDDQADGAWAKIEIDPNMPNRETASCFALKAYRLLNSQSPDDIPDFVTSDPDFSIETSDCNDVAESWEKDHPPAKPEFGTPLSLEQVLGMQIKWKHGKAAFVTDVADKEKKQVLHRYLTFWIAATDKEKLNKKLRLRLTGSCTIDVRYELNGKRLRDESFHYHPVVLFTHEFTSPLYVAEGHSMGTQFKQGMGIFFGDDVTDGTDYAEGRLPLATVEKLLGAQPFRLTLEDYAASFDQWQTQLKTPLIKEGEDFYRLLQINETGWPELIFTPPNKDKNQ